jgi:hypothetical protein
MANHMGEVEPKPPVGKNAETSFPEGGRKGVVFVGSSEGEEKNVELESEKQKTEDPKESKKKNPEDETKPSEKEARGHIGEKKTKTSDALKKAAEKDPILSNVLESHPIQTATVESFIMTRLQEGQSAQQIGNALKREVMRRRLSDESQIDARGFLTKLAVKTQNPDLLVPISGGSVDFILYEDGDIPDDKDPSRKEQHDRLIRDLQNLNEQRDAVPPLDREEDLESLNVIVKQLYDGAKEIRGKDGIIIPPEYNREDVDYIAKKIGLRRQKLAQESRLVLQERMQRQEDEQERREDKFSSIYLSKEEKIRLAIDSKSAVEQWLHRFYEPFGYPSGGEQASQDRVRMFLGYLESEEYQKEYFLLHKHFDDAAIKGKNVEEIRKFLDTASFDVEPPTQQELDNFHDTVKSTKTYVEAHTNLKLAAAAVETGAKIESIMGALSQGGDKMWYDVARANNGMNCVAFNLYIQELEVARGTTTSKLKRIGPAEFMRAKERTIEELQKNPIYRTMYGKDITKEEADHFYNVARVLAKVRQKTVLALIKSAGAIGKLDKEDVGLFGNVDLFGSSFVDAGTDEQIAAAMDWVRYFTEKWGNLSPGQQRIITHAYEFAAIDAGFEKIVDEEMRHDKDYAKNQDDRLKKEWGDNFKKWKLAKHGFMNRDKEYKRLLMADKGKLIFNDLLEMYDHDSSIWRGELILQQLEACYQNSETMALGLWLRRTGGDFITARSKEADEIFEYGKKTEAEGRAGKINNAFWSGKESGTQYGLSVRAALEQVAKYRPQALALMHYEQNNTEFTQWWDGMGKALAGAIGSDTSQGYAGVNNDVMHNFLNINELIARDGLAIINYQEGFSSIPDGQRDRVKNIVRDVFTARERMLADKENKEMPTEAQIAGKVDAYMTFMQGLSSHVGQEKLVSAFKLANYRQYLKRTQWVDDARLGYIEKPDELKYGPDKIKTPDRLRPMVKDDAEKRLPFSNYVSTEGESKRAGLARTWGDLLIGMELIPEVRNALSPDKEKLFKALEAIKSKEEIYNGAPNALRADIYLIAGWMKMAETDPSLLEIGSFLPNSSEMKRYFGDHAPSFGKSDLDSVLDAQDFVHSHMHLYPELEETVFQLEKYTGLAEEGYFGIFGKKHIDREHKLSPLYLRRYALFLLIIGALMAVELGKQAKSSLEQELGGGGGKR